MSRQSAESQFRKLFPDATIERRRPVHGKAYYLIREVPRAFMPCGEGLTPAEAWKDALEKHQRDLAAAKEAVNPKGPVNE